MECHGKSRQDATPVGNCCMHGAIAICVVLFGKRGATLNTVLQLSDRLPRSAEVLRFMRKSKGLSLKAAGKLCCIRSQAVAHIERGRWVVSREQAEKMVRSYGFTLDEYNAYMARKEVPIDKREECM